MQKAVEHNFARKLPPRQRIGSKNRERHGKDRRNRCHPQAQEYRSPFVLRKSKHDARPLLRIPRALLQDREALLRKRGLSFRRHQERDESLCRV